MESDATSVKLEKYENLQSIINHFLPAELLML